MAQLSWRSVCGLQLHCWSLVVCERARVLLTAQQRCDGDMRGECVCLYEHEESLHRAYRVQCGVRISERNDGIRSQVFDECITPLDGGFRPSLLIDVQ
jgi:hypothetical protein